MPRIPTHRVSSHPGEILREEYLGPLELSANALARRLGVDTPRINDIVRERRAVTPDSTANATSTTSTDHRELGMVCVCPSSHTP